MRTQAERSAAMRSRLIEVGLALFVEHGYAATSTSTLLAKAGASKGALYHHFSSKEALFEAIFEHVAEQSISQALLRPLGGPGSTEVEFSLTPTPEGGTLVEVEHRNLPTEHLPSHRTGWPMFMGRLSAVAR